MGRSTDASPNYMKPTSSSHAKKELFPVNLRNSTQSGSPDFKNLPEKISSDSKANIAVSSKKPGKSTDASPNYKKSTSSSHAKKELFPVSLRNSTQSGCPDFKNLPKKISSDSKAIIAVTSKKPTKALSRSSGLSLVRTLTKTTSFKASRSCPRKSTRASSMCAAAYINTTTTSSTPQRTSAMKVCPYTYCSLNGHHRAALAPLKSFMSQRRRAMKRQKSMKLMEALSPRRSKIPYEISKEDSDIEQNFYGGTPAYDEIAGMDIFIKIYAKEKDETGADEMGNMQKRPIENNDKMRNLNPREPNFFPLVPEPEAEKVDLKHQMMDERKNADDWMIDCALRQVVTKLAPAREKKVALLVEAFETVMPVPKFDTRISNNAAFAHTSLIQACS